MEQVGYSVIDSENKEIQFWGNTPGIYISAPEQLFLPGDISVCAPSIGSTYAGYKLVPRYIEALGTHSLKDGEQFSCDGTKVVITYTYRNPTKEELNQYNANERWKKETSGVFVGENFVYTDRQSQAMLTGITTLMTLNPNTTINFKTANGFIEANSTIMNEISLSVANHIQLCFSTEKNVSSNIESGYATTYEQITIAYK